MVGLREDEVAAAPFGLVERAVRVAEKQRAHRVAIGRRPADPAADRHPAGVGVGVIEGEGFDGLPEIFGDERRAIPLGIGQDDGKLLAAIAREQVA